MMGVRDVSKEAPTMQQHTRGCSIRLATQRTGSISVVRRADTPVGGTTVELAKGADTDVFAQVNVTGDRGW